MEKEKKKNKWILICFAVIILTLFIVAIVQTFVLKNKQNKLNTLNTEKAQIEQQLKDAKEKHDSIFNTDVKDDEITKDDLKDEYKDSYIKDNIKTPDGKPYGEEGEKIIEIQK